MKCLSCNNQLKPGTKFCEICGSPVKEINVEFQPDDQNQNAPAHNDKNDTIAFAPVLPHKEQGNTVNNKHNKKENNKHPKKENKQLIIIISVLASILLIMCVALIVVNLSGGNQADNTSSIVTVQDMDPDIFKTWYLTSGNKDHQIAITNDGYVTILSDPQSVRTPFTPITRTKLGITTNQGEKYTFEILGNNLVRQKNGKEDGHIYVAKDPSSQKNSTYSTTETPSKITSTNNVVSQPPKNIVYDESVLGAAIKTYQNYSNYSIGCDLGADASYSDAWNQLKDSQLQWAMELKEVDCCKSVGEAKTHLGKYLDANLYSNFRDSALMEYGEKLYCVIGSDGTSSYGTSPYYLEITRKDYNKVTVITKQYNSSGIYMNDTKFDFEYKDGMYKIVKVTQLT